MNLKGKRLLFIGATSMMATAVRTAKELGIYTVVVDYNKSAPAKDIADKSYLISTADIDGLLKICDSEKIDGVFFGYSEQNQYFALELTERYKFINYATKKQINILANKAMFKDCCRRFNVSCVPEFTVHKDFTQDELDSIVYPVIVKPVDSYSGKGISICTDEKQLISSIPKAINQSKCGDFLVEKYMSEEEYDIFTAYYSIQDGNIALSSIADRYMIDFENQRRLNTAILYPSQYLSRFVREMDKSICEMFKGIGLENGTVFLEGAVNESGFYLWEAGFRLCGAQQNIFSSYINGIDIQKMLICHALTGKMAEKNMMIYEDPSFKGKLACNGILYVRQGKIASIRGNDQVVGINGIISFTQLLSEGSEITAEDIGTLNQSFARFHAAANSQNELICAISSIIERLEVLDEKGENMLLNTFDFEKMFLKKRWV